MTTKTQETAPPAATKPDAAGNAPALTAAGIAKLLSGIKLRA